MQHRPAPHHRGVAGREHPDRDDLHPVRLGRHDHVFDLGRPPVRAQHAGHAVAVDVGVHHADGEPAGGQRGRQVDRDARLAHAALAARDRVHPGTRPGLRERDDRLRPGVPAQPGLQFAALLLAHHAEVDLHATHPADAGRRGRDVGAQLVPQRAAGDREQDGHLGDAVRAYRGRLHHAQVGDRAVDLRVLDGGQCGVQCRVHGRRGGRHVAHATSGCATIEKGCRAPGPLRRAAHPVGGGCRVRGGAPCAVPASRRRPGRRRRPPSRPVRPGGWPA